MGRGERSDDPRSDLLPGTLELLILRTLSHGSQHGYGIAQHIQRRSGEVFQVGEGSLYPALQRMTQRGWITAQWRRSETNRRARYYSLTPAGERRLGDAVSDFERLLEAIRGVLQPA